MDDLRALFARKAAAEMEELNRQVASCSRATSEPRLGVGNPLADLLAILERPDGLWDEVLVKSSERLDLSLDRFYSTSLLKCEDADGDSVEAGSASERRERPVAGGAPERAKCLSTCGAHLAAELKIVQPRVVLAMGDVVAREVCDVFGLEEDSGPGTVIKQCGRPAIIASVGFSDAMSDERSKKQLWHDLKLAVSECSDR